MIPRRSSFGTASFLLWAPLGTLVLWACSSSDDARSPTNDTDAGDGGWGISNVDASHEAGVDAGAVPPPPYDFAVKCAGVPCVTQIAARGGGHACAVLHDGSAHCWGSNDSGQLGTGRDDAGATSAYETSPRRVLDVSNATGVAATGQGTSGTTCVVSGTGEVACFGSDAWGQLGRGVAGSSEPHPDPAVIRGFQARSVTLTGTFALAIGTDDRLWSWGANDAFQLARAVSEQDAGDLDAGEAEAGSPDAGGPDAGGTGPFRPARADRISSPVRSCAGTSVNGFVVADGGDVLSWGRGTSEQLGRTTSASLDPVPRAIAISDASGVAAGAAHVCAVHRGSVHCWGDNDHGQLGTGRLAREPLPAAVALPADVYAVAVAAGGNDTCILSAIGDVHCWGANGSGQVGTDAGRDQSTPRRIGGLKEQAVAVAVMDASVCALLRGGSVVCWGDNLLGQLGRGARDLEIHVEAAPVVFK